MENGACRQKSTMATGRYPLPELRIGTNEDGAFAITNVPPGVEWYVYGKMESLAGRAGAPRAFDSQITMIGPGGTFAFAGLAKGDYSIAGSMEGYRLSANQRGSMPVTINRSITGLVITLDPQIILGR